MDIMDDHDEMKDCCLLCIHFTARKPPTIAEKHFWYCKKQLIESVATDDISGIYQMTHPNRCRHYARKVAPQELERLKRLQLSYGRHMPPHEAEKLRRLLENENKADDPRMKRQRCFTCNGQGQETWPGDEDDIAICHECCGDGYIEVMIEQDTD